MDKTLNNLGLAKRSGKTISGTDKVCEGLRNNNILLVFLAHDTAVNTYKKVTDKCSYYNTEIITKYSSEELSKALGVLNCHVVGIVDRGFAKLLKE